MNKNQRTGKQGEEIAAAWLEQQGFQILFCNWRYSYYELDIVAQKGEVLHFVEVKTRKSVAFGDSAESITVQKLKGMMSAGEAYQEQYPGFVRLQYDLIGIQFLPDGSCAINYEEDLSL